MDGTALPLVAVVLVSSSKDTVSFGNCFGGALGGAFGSLSASSDTTSFGGAVGGAATLGGKDCCALGSKPGAS